MTNQPVPYLHMDAQQLETHRALMQTQSSVAELVSHLEEAKDVDVKVGALWGRDAQMLQTTVLSPTEMYKVAKQYGLDEQCLKIMSISGYTDPVVILSHWKCITETVLNSVGANKLEVLKAKVVNLAHEFNHASNRGYFPLSFVLEVLIRACLKSPAMTYESLKEWFTSCMRECGIEYDLLVSELLHLVNAVGESRWMICVSGLYAKW